MSFFGKIGRGLTAGLTLGGSELLGVGQSIEDGTLLDPSKKERDAATGAQQDAINEWKKVPGRIPSTVNFTPQAYEMGGTNTAVQAQYYDPGQTAYDSTPGIAGAQSYFQGLTTSGTDPIADAQYAKGVQQAESARRSQAAAAASAAEAAGQGNAGSRALGEAMANQGMASDMYASGTQRAADSATRRDAAATSLYGIASDRANAVDNFAIERSRGITGVNEKNATRAQDASDANVTRSQQVSDANIGAQNDATFYNSVTSPQQYFDNYMAYVNGLTGQYGSAAGTYINAGQMAPDYLKTFSTLGGNVAKGAGLGAPGGAAGAPGGAGGAPV